MNDQKTKSKFFGSDQGMVASAVAFAAMVVAVTVGICIPMATTRSAALTYISDEVDNPLVSVSTNHLIAFVTPTGVDAPTDTIQLTFQGFDLSQITVGDMDLSHGTTTGYEFPETLAASAGAGAWGASISGQVLTLTAPTDAAADEIAPSSTIRLLIGTNAAGGTHQIVNPATSNNYTIAFAGTFGDTGAMGLPIVDNNQVSVTASYPPPPPSTGGEGGHGGTPSDTTPPVIMSVQATNITGTTARITWATDELSTSQVDFGNNLSYASGTVVDGAAVTSHTIDLTGLLSCATYYYRVSSTDGSGNTGSAGGFSFMTVCDTTPPVLSNIHAANLTDTSAIILWNTDEPATSVLDFGLTNAYGQHSADGSLLTSHSMPIAGLLPNTTYHYRVTSSDARGNTAASSDQTFQTAADTTPPANAALTATAGDGKVDLSWTNPSDPDFAGVRIVRRTDHFPTDAADGSIIYSGNGTSFTDNAVTNGSTYYYGAFAYDTAGNFASGSLASAMPQGVIPPVITPTSTPPVNPPVVNPPVVIPPVVNPPVVNPPVVIPPVVNPPITPVTPPVLPAAGVTTTPATPSATIVVNFRGAGGALPLSSDDSGTVGVRSNSTITVSVPVMSMNGTPQIVAFVLGNSTFNLTYDQSSSAYTGMVQLPSVIGTYTTKAQAIFTDGRVAEKFVNLRVQGVGAVYEKQVIGAGRIPIPGAIVRLFRDNGGSGVSWDGTPYGQYNPLSTDANGTYVFEVPPGRYYMEVQKEGYEMVKTESVYIDGNVFNQVVYLIKIPTHFTEAIGNIISSNAPVTQKAAAIAQNIGQNVVYEVKRLQQDVLESPQTKAVTTNIVSPAAITVTVVNAASAFSVFNLLTYLQYLFTQPVLLFWRRKRKAYGTVYDSLTKRPVDLAILRLIHSESGVIVQTRVTDKRGRYIMSAKPGTYRIEVIKQNFSFPTSYLSGKKVDIDYNDLYHGDVFTMSEEGGVAFNIPVDPIVAEETPRKILLRMALRKTQHIVAFSGVLISAISFLIVPTVMMGGFVMVQVIVYIVFRRLSLTKRPKKLGKVYDVLTNKPLSRAMVRIYDAKFKKLLETQMTDSRGRYGFLVGKNVYYLTGGAKGYDAIQMPDIDLTKGEGVIDKTIPLMRTTSTKERQVAKTALDLPEEEKPEQKQGEKSDPTGGMATSH